MSFKILNDTELWDYQYTSFISNSSPDCQKICEYSDFCAGFKYYPSTFNVARYKQHCYLYYWAAESTKTSMPGATSGVKLNARARDKNCQSDYVLSDTACTFDTPIVLYSTFNDAKSACDLNSKCVAVEINQKFSLAMSLPDKSSAECVKFTQANPGIQVSYFVKSGDKNKCNQICGIGDSLLSPCSSNKISEPPIDTPDTYEALIIAVSIIVIVFTLLGGFIVIRYLRSKKGLRLLKSQVTTTITTPKMEKNELNRQTYTFENEIDSK